MKTIYSVTYAGGKVITQQLSRKQINTNLINAGKICTIRQTEKA